MTMQGPAEYDVLLRLAKALDAAAETALAKINATLASNRANAREETPGKNGKRVAASLGATGAQAK